MEPTCFKEFQNVTMTIYGLGIFAVFVFLMRLLKGDFKLALLHLIGLRSHAQPTWFKVVIWVFLLSVFVVSIALVQRCST